MIANITSMLLSLTMYANLAGADDSPKPPVDLLIVVAVDVSSSVTDESQYEVDEYALQKQGFAEALKDPQVVQVVEQCNSQGIGLTYVEWSGAYGNKQVHQIVPWTHLQVASDLEDFADQVLQTKRSSRDFTDIISALEFSKSLIETAPFTSKRKLIDISTDGKQNVYDRDLYQHVPQEDEHLRNLMKTRDAIVASGISINALVITNDRGFTGKRDIVEYHKLGTQGGPGSFTHEIRSYKDIAEAIRERLLIELNHCMM